LTKPDKLFGLEGHNKKHPIEMGEKEIGEFITHQAKNQFIKNCSSI